jgi:hypothetical protein
MYYTLNTQPSPIKAFRRHRISLCIATAQPPAPRPQTHMQPDNTSGNHPRHRHTPSPHHKNRVPASHLDRLMPPPPRPSLPSLLRYRVYRDSISSNISSSRMSTPKKTLERSHITPPLQKSPGDVFCKCTKNAGDAAVVLLVGVSGG